MIPPKLQKWIDKEVFPQRILLSGQSGMIDIAIEIAVQLQNINRTTIEKGIHQDTIVFRDDGKSFKIDWSDAAKKDEQSEHENVRGLIRWAHQKPDKKSYRIIILENIERLTNEAPHACLKLIEEPPAKTIFLLTTQNHHNNKILQTILSRVTVIRIAQEQNIWEIEKAIEDFFTETDILKKFQYIEDLDKTSKDNKDKKIDRNIFLKAIENMIQYARSHENYQKNLPLLLDSYTAIQQNVNPRLTLERIAITITTQ